MKSTQRRPNRCSPRASAAVARLTRSTAAPSRHVGNIIALASHEETVRLWSASSGQLLQTLEGHSQPVEAVCFSPDGNIIASASEDKMARLWSMSSGQLLQTLKGHSESVYVVCFSPDGNIIASASEDKTVRLWGASGGHVVNVLRRADQQTMPLVACGARISRTTALSPSLLCLLQNAGASISASSGHSRV